MDYPDHANIAVQERGSAGSDSLAGNHMAEWIYTHLLRPTLVEALAAQGVTAADLPVHFSWQPLPAEGVSHIQDRNGLALASAVFDLQRNDGPIGELLGRLGSDDSYQGRDADDIYAFNRALAADDDESRKLWTRMTEVWRQMAYVPPALELATASGQAVQVAWPRTGLAIDFKQIMRTFRARFQQPMRAHLNRLVAAFDGASATDRPARVVVSGRGSLFPLFSRTVLAEIEWAFGDRAHTIHLISPAMAKAITSMGACYLARLVARDPNVRFVADIPHRLAIVAGPDPADPNRHRVTPFAGADLNGGSDGLMTAPARLPHGRSSRIIELVMVNDDEESVELDGTRVVARVHAVLEIPRGKTSYVVVRPVDAEHIDVGLALTDQPVPETPAEADFDTLHWLGQHHLPRA